MTCYNSELPIGPPGPTGPQGPPGEGAALPYKIYTALLTQTGIDAPVAIELENTIGNISFSYLDVGTYQINLPIPIDIDKTFLYIGNGAAIQGRLFTEEEGFKTICFINISGVSSTLVLYSSQDGTGSGYLDNKFNKTPIEIRVYN
jgi:hypothetical protein